MTPITDDTPVDTHLDEDFFTDPQDIGSDDSMI